jgi:glycosyltransferase involved in cell wall biosynthesis
MRIRVAILATDRRECDKDYANPKPSFMTPVEALLQGVVSLPEIEVHVVSCAQKPLTSSPEKLADNIWYHSVLVPKLGWMRTGYQGCIRAIRKKLRQLQPDIVHGEGAERDCAISAVFSGFPNVLTIHGNMRLIARLNHERPFSYNWLSAKLEGFALPRTNGVVCITNYTREAVADLARQTWVVPNAVDESLFEIQSEPKPNDVPVILCVGTVMFRKNQNAFIRALDPLAAQHRFKLVFLGQAQRGQPFQDEFFQLLQSRPWCSYEGFIDSEKLKTYFQSASALVLPSLEDNCPMVVLEAMAVGVPVLAARVGGVPDLIEADVTGLLCNPLDEASMRTGMAKLLESPNLRRELATTAKCRARQRFHPVVVAKHHLEIYREVLRARPQTSCLK